MPARQSSTADQHGRPTRQTSTADQRGRPARQTSRWLLKTPCTEIVEHWLAHAMPETSARALVARAGRRPGLRPAACAERAEFLRAARQPPLPRAPASWLALASGPREEVPPRVWPRKGRARRDWGTAPEKCAAGIYRYPATLFSGDRRRPPICGLAVGVWPCIRSRYDMP